MFFKRFQFPPNYLLDRTLCTVLWVFVLFSANAALADSYFLSAGDRLRITLLENEQVNDTYTIEIGGTVSVPGIGIVDSTGLSLRAFEERLREKAAETIVDPSISVQIVEYRPFFVLGDVAQPGLYPYIADLNVMKAIAIAGGFGREVNSSALSRSIAINSARKSLIESQIDLFSARVNLARLLAERRMDDEFGFEVERNAFLSRGDQQAIIKGAQELFATRQTAFKSETEKLGTTLASRVAETESYSSQIELQNEILVTSEKVLQKLQAAKERGIVSDARINTVVRDEQNARARMLQIITLKRQSEVNKASVEQELSERATRRSVDIDQSIQFYEESIQRLNARSREDRAFLIEVGAPNLASSSGEPIVRLELHRDGQRLDEEIALNSKVQPGDTLFAIVESDVLKSN